MNIRFENPHVSKIGLWERGRDFVWEGSLKSRLSPKLSKGISNLRISMKLQGVLCPSFI